MSCGSGSISSSVSNQLWLEDKHGNAWHGMAWTGYARPGLVGQGGARSGKARFDFDVLKRNVARSCVARPGLVRRGMARRGLFLASYRHGWAWCGLVGHGNVRLGRARQDKGLAAGFIRSAAGQPDKFK